MHRLKLYLAATRAQFFPAIVLPVMLGAACAQNETNTFHAGLFIVTLAASILFHAGMNVTNDYFDFKNGTDNANANPLTPFAGGSRMIQNGLMSPHETLGLAVVLLTLGSLAGIYLVFEAGTFILVLGLVGLISGVLYSAPWVFLAGRGLGELTVALNFGLLAVVGSFYVQAGELSLQPVLASIPLSLLIAALLYMNEFPDYEADKGAGKNNLVVRLGPEKARYGMVLIVASTYLSLVICVAASLMPTLTLIALISIVFAVPALTGLMKNYKGNTALIPAIKMIIATHASTGALLTLAYIL